VSDEDFVERACRKIIASLHPKQRQFALDQGRRVNALVGRGGGKTTGARARLAMKALRLYKAKLVYVATTRQQAGELMWYPLKDLLDNLGVAATFNETERKCTIGRTGATIRLVGADDKREIDKLRGQSFHEVQIDEAASYPTGLLEALMFRVVGPRLGDLDGCIVMFGTPGHILSGPFYDSTRPGSDSHRPFEERHLPEYDGWQRWSSHSWTLQDGARSIPAMGRLWSEAQREKEANGWSDDNPIWMREYLGRWAADDTSAMFRYRAHVEGVAWNQWDPERVGPYKIASLPPGDWLYGYGMDPGTRDPLAINVFAVNPADPDRKIFHVFGFDRRDMYARTIAELLIGEDAIKQVARGDGLPDSIGGLYAATGWPVEARADIAGQGEGLLNELANVYGIRFLPAQKRDKFSNIEVVNGQLVDGKLMILKGSKLEEQMTSLQWRPDEYGNLREDKGARNDHTDSCLYIVPELLKLFEGRQAAQPTHRVPSARTSLLGDDAEVDDRGGGEFSSLLGTDSYDDLWG
jgi:hypothetical protein